PPWTAWYIHQLPEWFHKLSTAGMFFIELAIPFLIFAPRRFRWIGGIGIIFLQVLIILTGNYCFFNILSIILCVWLLDDSTFCPKWQTKLKKFFQDDLIPKSSPSRSRWRWLGYPASGILVLISLMILSSATFRIQVKWPGALNTLYSVQSPFHMVNSYGLFANMTTERPEIIIEGSNDGETWTPYSFKFKPGNPDKKPSFVAPHQPRLDWHMWFAALGSVNQNVWVVNLCVRLLQGSEPVTSLLRQNPFPDNPPRYIRAQLYNYR
ncbi:MAG: hypothetical protein GWN16_16525, partial [Calditrichae bacterium]|nr:hypothetical protein [Calditrichia bacterium]